MTMPLFQLGGDIQIALCSMFIYHLVIIFFTPYLYYEYQCTVLCDFDYHHAGSLTYYWHVPHGVLQFSVEKKNFKKLPKVFYFSGVKIIQQVFPVALKR